MGDMISVREAADYLNVSAAVVRKWLREGRLPGVNLGGRAGWRLSETELIRRVERGGQILDEPKEASSE